MVCALPELDSAACSGLIVFGVAGGLRNGEAMSKWRRWVAAFAIGASLFGVAACDSDPDPTEIDEPGNPTEDPDNPLDPTLPDE